MEKVRLDEAFGSFDERWAPQLAAEVNDHALKLAKVEGEFISHHHETDELFLVRSGEVHIEFEDRPGVTLGAGELLVVPAGVEHRPVAEGEAELLLFEARGTRNTGSAGGEQTRAPIRLED
jgi:mannose-6-phosphate isomerase-like protein (cupin superfamily)